MANKTWTGGNSQWSVAGNWNPSGVPIAGDTALITATSGTPNVTVGIINETIDGITIQIGSTGSSSGQQITATLVFDGASTIGADTTITATTGFVAIRSPGTLTIAGQIEVPASGGKLFIEGVGSAQFASTGQLTVGAGQEAVLNMGGGQANDGLILVDGGTVYVDSALTGSGTVQVQAGGQFQVSSTVAGQSIQLGSDDFNNPSTIIFEGTSTLDAASTITVTDVAAQIRAPGTLTIEGHIDASQAGGYFFFDAAGSVTLASGGQMTFGAGQSAYLRMGSNTGSGTGVGLTNDGLILIDGAQVYSQQFLTGTGTVDIMAGGLFEVAAVDAGQTITFLDSSGILSITDPTEFAGTIAGMQAGNSIILADGAVDAASFDAVTGLLTLSLQGSTVATLQLDGVVDPLSFSVEVGRDGNTHVYSSDAFRSWDGSTGDWFDATHWSSNSSSSSPLAGDTVLISGGTAVISPEGMASLPIHDVTLLLNGTAADPGGIRGSSLTIEGNSSILVTGDSSHGRVLLSGDNTLLGEVAIQAHQSSLTFRLNDDGHAGTLDIVNTSLVVGTGGTMQFFGGEVMNGGLITTFGRLYFGSDAVLSGVGIIDIIDGGVVEIDGAVHTGQEIHFGDLNGTLQLGDLSHFHGEIDEFQQGDVIILEGVQVTSTDWNDQNGHLRLFNGQDQVGTITVWPGTVFDGAEGSFVVAADGDGNTRLTYHSQPVIVDVSIPVAAVGDATQMLTLREILVNAFGEVPTGFTSFTLSGPGWADPSTYPDAFWGQPQQTPPGQGVPPTWYVGGTALTESMVVSAAQLDQVQFLVGNQIPSTAWFGVSTATDGNGNSTQFTKYNMWSVDPGISTYVPGQAPTAAAMAQSMLLHNNFYNNVLNTDNCNWIADDVAAAIGATMPFMNYSNDPDENREGGFWRIAHNGAQDPVANWSTLVQPGDVVRMGWAGIDVDNEYANLSWHTTSIYQVVTDPNTGENILQVYDNVDFRSNGQEYIGLHDADYWTDTVPESITIYRLDPNGQYLIDGNSANEYIHGTVFNDLIRPILGGATITGGPGDDQITGTIANLDRSTLTDFNVGDRLHITDLGAATATLNFDAASDTLTVFRSGSAVASFLLPNAPVYQSFVIGYDAEGGTIIRASSSPAGGGDRPDILWRGQAGEVAIWEMRDDQIAGGGAIPLNPGSYWNLSATGDFNADGRTDVLWRGHAGEVTVWELTGNQITGGGLVAFNPGSYWNIGGAADFNGDGRTDILWRGQAGEVTVWEMNGSQISGGGNVAFNPGQYWNVAGTGDFNGDGRADILWRGVAGEVTVWEMDGNQITGGGNVAFNPGEYWSIGGTGDFNGDGRTDILWRGQAGEVTVWEMDGNQITGGGLVASNPGEYWSIGGTGDFNGDDRADILWRGQGGEVAIWQMDGNQIIGGGNVAMNPGSYWQIG